ICQIAQICMNLLASSGVGCRRQTRSLLRIRHHLAVLTPQHLGKRVQRAPPPRTAGTENRLTPEMKPRRMAAPKAGLMAGSVTRNMVLSGPAPLVREASSIAGSTRWSAAETTRNTYGTV